MLETLAKASESTSTIGPKRARLDINDDGTINMKDVSAVTARFGMSGQNMTKTGRLYDSGWINLTDYDGKNYTLVDNLRALSPMMLPVKVYSSPFRCIGAVGESIEPSRALYWRTLELEVFNKLARNYPTIPSDNFKCDAFRDDNYGLGILLQRNALR